MKALIAMTVAAVPILLTFTLGAATGARGSAAAWVLSAVLCLVGSAVFAVYGLLVGTAFRSEAAVGAAAARWSSSPSSATSSSRCRGPLLSFAKFTPLYGYAALARYPLTEGYLPDGSQDPLWLPIVNVLAWLAIFGALAVVLVRRGRERQ